MINEGAVTAPIIVISGIEDYRITQLTLPEVLVDGEGENAAATVASTGTGAFTLPVVTVSGHGGDYGEVTLPYPPVSGSELGSSWGSASLSVPVGRVSGFSYLPSNGIGTITLPASTIAGSGFVNSFGAGAITVTVPTIS